MNDLYSDVSQYKVNRSETDFEVREECLAKISRQTVDCCQFIKHYTSNHNFCMTVTSASASRCSQLITQGSDSRRISYRAPMHRSRSIVKHSRPSETLSAIDSRLKLALLSAES